VPYNDKEDNNSRKHIIILGSGFAGIQVFKNYKRSSAIIKMSILL
jgi:NADH dehydrogenase FAD-containing subunit